MEPKGRCPCPHPTSPPCLLGEGGCGGGLSFVVFLTAVMILSGNTQSALAANAGVAPPLVEQCNDSGEAAGMELRCTIEVVNYLNADGTLASSPDSTVTITVCEGAASGGAVPCDPPITTVSQVPVTTARQCNHAYYGGGSWIECEVDLTPFPSTAILTLAVDPVQGVRSSSSRGRIVGGLGCPQAPFNDPDVHC